MKRAYKFRAYPTRPQGSRAHRMLDDFCDLYNAALEERCEAWRMRKTGVTYGIQAAQLRAIRATDPAWHGRYSYNAQQQVLRRLDAVFRAFFRRVKAGQKAGYPRFKSCRRFNQAVFTNGGGSKWVNAGPDGWGRASFQAIGSIKVAQHRCVRGTVKTLQLKRENRRWYVIVVTDTNPVPLAGTGREVGVDVGVARFLTTSDAEVVANPRILSASLPVIADLHRRLSGAKRGSGNRKRIRRQLGREYRKIGDRRRDFHHKTARALVDACDTVALEKLNVNNMTRRPAPKPDGDGGWLPNGAAAKAGLNRSILDAGWGQFARILAAKAEEAGRQVIFVDPAYTSIDCHVCGTRCTRPKQAVVVCPVHGEIDADVNGARNIASRAGLGSGQDAQAA